MASGAAAAVVWLVLSYRSERLEIEAGNVAIRAPAITAAQSDAALRKIRRARALQADAGPKLAEWRLLHFRGRAREAQALAEEIVHSEPANAEAWFYLAENARDPALAREARRRFRELQPPPSGDG